MLKLSLFRWLGRVSAVFAPLMISASGQTPHLGGKLGNLSILEQRAISLRKLDC